MIAKTFHQYQHNGVGFEWRVYFPFNEIWDDLPKYRAEITEWIEANITGEHGQDWRLSSYSIFPYAAFLTEEDALLCFLAFQ